MKSQNLLSLVSRLENELGGFSFEELTAEEASNLKSAFTSFKESLERKVNRQAVSTLSLGNEEQINEGSFPTKKKQLKNRSNSKEGALIATVSHELRTPLNGILGFSGLLKESNLNTEQLEYVDAIQSASRNLLDIINELMEFSKLSLGMEKFEQVDFNVRGIIKDVLYLCNTLILNKKVSIRVNLDAKIPDVLIGDPSKLSQILLNLIGNSIKFVETGEIVLSVKLIRKSNGIWLEFIVTDTGIGIAEENLKHIFESFRQAEPNTHLKYGGSGLGLSIVKQLIEKLEGDITVSSKVGVGTSFKFILPYKVGNALNLQRGTNNNKYEYTDKELVKNLRVLVFEDNLLNQRLIEQRLKSWGCVRHITDNPLYGLTILDNHQIDIILMDLRMPGMSGYEVTQRIRNSKSDHIKQIPIIALTADFTVQDKEQGDLIGINDYILKPYTPDELLSKLVKNKRGEQITFNGSSKVQNSSITSNSQNGIVNMKAILAECMGEIGLLEELVQLFKQNAYEFIGKTKIHLKDNDFNGIEFAAHKIKSGIAMIQAHTLHSIMVQIHKCARDERDITKLKSLYADFILEYPKVENAILAEVEKLKNESNGA